MEKKISIELTEQELRILQRLIQVAPVQGNVQTLPNLLGIVLGIMKKIEDALIPAWGDRKDGSAQ